MSSGGDGQAAGEPCPRCRKRANRRKRARTGEPVAALAGTRALQCSGLLALKHVPL